MYVSIESAPTLVKTLHVEFINDRSHYTRSVCILEHVCAVPLLNGANTNKDLDMLMSSWHLLVKQWYASERSFSEDCMKVSILIVVIFFFTFSFFFFYCIKNLNKWSLYLTAMLPNNKHEELSRSISTCLTKEQNLILLIKIYDIFPLLGHHL